MKNKYQVEVLDFKEVHEIPNAWTNNDFINLLKFIDYDDVDSFPEEEMKDMCPMALSDLSIEEAIESFLEFSFGDKLSKGKRQNLVEEIQEERIWEEYSEISFREELFNVYCLLYWTFTKKFSEPDIVRINLSIRAANPHSKSNLENVRDSFLCRILNDGTDEHNIIYRLIDEQLESNSFPETEHIIWKFSREKDNTKQDCTVVQVYTSWNWVDELKEVKNYESLA